MVDMWMKQDLQNHLICSVKLCYIDSIFEYDKKIK